MPTAVLLGTFDTKGNEYRYVQQLLEGQGIATLTVDAGVLGEPAFSPDVTRSEVAAAAGADLADLVARADRGSAVSTMAEGAARIVARLREQGRCDGALALGGTGGTAIASRAFRGLPLGVPKIIVSTAASGDVSHYIGESDLVLMPSVTDIAGVNRLSSRILTNAAASLAGMMTAPQPTVGTARALVGASMFGVTTPCVMAGQKALEELGYEVLVFHMTGVGGRTLENLVEGDWLAGVFDVTTTELADELVGGVFSAGAGRLTAAARKGVPQVVSVGALDMVNFGAPDTIPQRFSGRNFYPHNPSVTLMRTTPEECAELGRRLAHRISQSIGPAAVFLPLRGVSAISGKGGPFYDPDADEALFSAIRAELDRSRVDLVELDLTVNDPEFAAAMVTKLQSYLEQRRADGADTTVADS